MKLVTYDDGRVGKVVDGTVIELDVPDMRRYFELQGEVEPTGRETPLDQVHLRAPIIPKKFFHTAGNFREHHEESTRVNWSHPVLPWIVFFQNIDAIIGPDDPIIYPEGMTNELDYELELAVVIGKAGKFFSPEEAEDYIAGYIVFNDITARDIQKSDGQWTRGKGWDTFCPTGPLVSNEIDPITTPVTLTTHLNGTLRQTGSTADLIFPIPELLRYISAFMTLEPGDLIPTGTPSGVGPMQPGDLIQVSIPTLGILSNILAAE